tara:strand:+ start:19 stop:360 length:342 start_codon:yes stop_codon:yes gene_type:complete
MGLFGKALLDQHDIVMSMKMFAVLLSDVLDGVYTAKRSGIRIPVAKSIYKTLSFKYLKPQMIAFVHSPSVRNYKGQLEFYFIVDNSCFQCRNNKALHVSDSGSFELKRGGDDS